MSPAKVCLSRLWKLGMMCEWLDKPHQCVAWILNLPQWLEYTCRSYLATACHPSLSLTVTCHLSLLHHGQQALFPSLSVSLTKTQGPPSRAAVEEVGSPVLHLYTMPLHIHTCTLLSYISPSSLWCDPISLALSIYPIFRHFQIIVTFRGTIINMNCLSVQWHCERTNTWYSNNIWPKSRHD